MRRKLFINGIVQGVGFRPFVHFLATRHGLTGYVLNNGLGVEAEVQGAPEEVGAFLAELPLKAPPVSQIESISVKEMAEAEGDTFDIRKSRGSGEKFSLVSPDIATCDDCLDEMNDPSDRRYEYPFINCTNCGPRFTIIRDVPYDRPMTTMDVFPMCPDCEREYGDPSNRRFHAQPNACPACGPSLALKDSTGGIIAVKREALAEAVRMLTQGKILAVKGIGGYHLACDASDETAVAALRSRKYREDKPFAVMVPDLAAARVLCYVTGNEARALLSSRRPIVLCSRKPCPNVAFSVAPLHKYLGLMMPYAPLHHLLLSGAGRPLVMTSGNRSDEPIAYDDLDVGSRIGGIADAYLTHDRKIHMRSDDSVARVWRGAERLVRRARGYAPAPVKLGEKAARPILACGAELKNTFCVVRGDYAFVSQHIGDLDNLETLTSYEEGIAHYERLFHVSPEVIAYDMHPEYLSTKYALARDGMSEKIGVQHHHAHIVSCLADNMERGPAIGVAMDGLGYGPDGMLWGGEWLVGDAGGFVRAAHLKPFPMPGGALAIKQPWRMAAALLSGEKGADVRKFSDFAAPLAKKEEIEIVLAAIERRINCPMTTSMGRVFDAVSALVTGRREINYEGQAAIELEMLASEENAEPYSYTIEKAEGEGYSWGEIAREAEGCLQGLVVGMSSIIMNVAEDLRNGENRAAIAARFHSTVAAAIAEVTAGIRSACGYDTVALSGGVFQNMRLLEETAARLEQMGFRVLAHRRVPTNDGGLSLGQAAVAAEVLRRSI
ncbi:MAG: carbamoyltransferase HypF [bacterium]